METTSQDVREPHVPSYKSSFDGRSNAFTEHKKRVSLGNNDTFASAYEFDAVTIPITEPQQTFSFAPVATVLRAHIPLSWISGYSSILRAGTLLQAKIISVSVWDYHILVVKLRSAENLFALERIGQDAYTCHPLQSWVKTSWVEKAAFGAAPAVDLNFLSKIQTELGHARKLSNTSITNPRDSFRAASGTKIPQNRRGHIARLSILESRGKTEEPLNIENVRNYEEERNLDPDRCIGKDTDPIPTSTSQTDTNLHGICTDSPVSISPVINTETVPVAEQLQDPKSTDHLSSEHLRRQYLETLYISKTSLAFYAKGPLSRARARARAIGASRSPEDLANFYRESIVPTKKFDLKYRESIQKQIASSTSFDMESLEAGGRQIKKSRRTKLGKDGLWPLEEEYIGRKWKSLSFEGDSSHTMEALSSAISKMMSELRMRETEMQIILILEVLALEARDVAVQRAADSLPSIDVKIEAVENESTQRLADIPSRKKQRDLKSELGFLIDRLCIWHSIGFEDAITTASNQQKSGSTSEKSKDRLRDFCKEVIVPFYGGKLPEQCRIICGKMGGSEISPQRSKGNAGKETPQQPPGAVISREHAPNKRNLQYVLSEDNDMRHASPPVLSRSATLPTQMSVKREPSERPVSRSAIQKSISFSNREVDLVADARATAAKRRKLDLVAAQKLELDAAIETLKRPNRSHVAKSIMDDLEQRTRESRSSVIRCEPVQITATPKRGRTKQVQMDEYDLPPLPMMIAPLEDLVVPSSTAKPRGLSQISHIPRSSAPKRAVLSAIYDTPTRGRSDKIKMIVPNHDGTFDDIESESRDSNSTLVTTTPAKSCLRLNLGNSFGVAPMRMTKSQKPVLLTPLEKSEAQIEQAFKDAPEIPERAGKAMDRAMGSKSDTAELSLYDSLGWNDDYDL